MRKEFELELLASRWLYIGYGASIVLLALLIWIQAGKLAVAWFVLVVLSALYFRYYPPTVRRKVALTEIGVELVDQERTIAWSQLKWYRVDFNHPVVNVLSIGIQGQLFATRLSGLKSGEELSIWHKMRKGIMYQGKRRNLSFCNYFSYPIWTLIQWLMVLVWVGVFVSFFIPDFAEGRRKTGLIYAFYGTIRLWLMISDNRRNY